MKQGRSSLHRRTCANWTRMRNQALGPSPFLTPPLCAMRNSCSTFSSAFCTMAPTSPASARNLRICEEERHERRPRQG